MIRVQLELIAAGDALTGRIGLDGEPTRPFTGWTGLTGAIDDLLIDSRGTQPRTSDAAGWSP